MDGFPQTNEALEMAFTFLLFYAAASYRIISEMESLPGFGFVPNNEQIIDYLKRKRLDPHFSVHMILEMDIYSCEPWELQGNSGMQSKEQVLHIFSEPYYKYAKSKRAHRRTNEGYWKVTGQGSKIRVENSPDAIGSKRILSFYHRGYKTDWVMHEFFVEDDPRYKKDFVLCRIEKKRDNKHGILTNDEGQSNQQMVPNSGNHGTKNTISEAVQQPTNKVISNRDYDTENIFLKTWLLPSDHVIFNSGSQTEENIPLYCQQLSSDCSIFSSGNQVAENACKESQVLANHNMISPSGNHVAEKACKELQVPPNCNMIPYSGNHIAGNGSLASQLQPNQHLDSYSISNIEKNTSDAKRLLLSEFNAPIYSEQGSLYSNCSNNGGSKLIDYQINSGRAFQNAYSCESGQTPIPHCNSSKPGEGFDVEDISDRDIEAMVDEYLQREISTRSAKV